MFTVDLQDGYYHVNMSHRAIPYMGLQWEDQFYAYVVLPFGLAISPLVFCKIIRAIIIHLRKKGHRILAYLDDFIGLTQKGSLRTRTALLKLLRRLGFHISIEKSSLNLEMQKEFLGLLLDSQNRPMFLVPPKKKQMVTTEINRLARSHLPLPARQIARVAGLCISLSSRPTSAFTSQSVPRLTRRFSCNP